MNRHWLWTARRVLISAFLLFHVGATLIWVMPACPIHQRFCPALKSYMMPLGLWQAWAMFAPDPARDPVALEAEVVDSHGLRHRFDFPKMADLSWWWGIPYFRYSKYAANLSIDEFESARKFAARHSIRRLGLPADSFPLEVHLVYRFRLTPPPGSPPPDPMAPKQTHVLAHYVFSTIDEVRP